jgi:hypothetical protein
VIFGGRYNRDFDETWEWRGADWIRHAPANSPSARSGHAMVYDAVRRRVLLFGGQSILATGLVTHGDTWEWDGSTWTQRSPANRPPARTAHAMVFDLVRQRVVMFGGIDAANGGLGDTWEWDGSDWLQRTPSASPGPIATHAMAYDAARQRTVLFGGSDRMQNYYDATWEWDGRDWTLRSPVTRPSPRLGPAMAYDSSRKRTVLYGGRLSAGTSADTWEWDGSDWRQVIATSKPGHRVFAQMTYDPARQRMLLIGGESVLYPYTVFEYCALRPARSQRFGTGCATGTAPALVPSSDPHLGNSAFGLEVHGARAVAACLFGLSASAQSRSIPPCTLFLQGPIVPLPASTNAAGFAASAAIPLPLDFRLRGAMVYAQAFVVDPSAPALGVAFTGGLALTLGD